LPPALPIAHGKSTATLARIAASYRGYRGAFLDRVAPEAIGLDFTSIYNLIGTNSPHQSRKLWRMAAQVLRHFHPLIRRWFEERFAELTRHRG